MRIPALLAAFMIVTSCATKPLANTDVPISPQQSTSTVAATTQSTVAAPATTVGQPATTTPPLPPTVAPSKGTIDNFGDRLRAQAAAAMMQNDVGYRACAVDPIGCDRSYLTETAVPDAAARANAYLDKRITDKLRRRPNPNPDLDYTVVEKVEFDGDFDHVNITVCFVDGATLVYIGNQPSDLAIVDDSIGGSRVLAKFTLGGDDKWRIVDSTRLEAFDTGRPTCAPRNS